MYFLTTQTTYKANYNYYTKNGNEYTLLKAGTDYIVGSNIPTGTYVKFEYDMVYINEMPFPYKPNPKGDNETPIHEAGQNDLDLDAYTNTKGYTQRNRIRHDVKTLDFSIDVMSGQELKDLLAMRSPVWFKCTFFDESEWTIVTKTMYCSSPKYTKYYIDKNNPLLNIYTDISFGFVEE